MRTSAKRLIILPLLAVSFMILAPTSVMGQCAVTNSSVATFGSVIYVYKNIAPAASCSVTASMNVNGCFPPVTTSTTLLSASAQTTATNPSCNFNCTCGSVTIDGSDGLPVELLQFSVEEESPVPEAIESKKITGKLEED